MYLPIRMLLSIRLVNTKPKKYSRAVWPAIVAGARIAAFCHLCKDMLPVSDGMTGSTI